jgi:hypothetical protein
MQLKHQFAERTKNTRNAFDDEALSAQYKSFTNNTNIAAIVCDVTDSISYFLYYSHFSSLYIISMIK